MLKRLLFVVLLLVEAAAADPIHLGLNGIWGQFAPGYFISSISASAGNFEIIGGNGMPYHGNGTAANPYLYSSGTWPLLQQSFPVPGLHCESTFAPLASWPICATLNITAGTGYFSDPLTFHFTGVFVAVLDQLFYLAAGAPPQPGGEGIGDISMTLTHIGPELSNPLWSSTGTANLSPVSDSRLPEVPEPATLLLLGSGFLATVARRIWH
jgi:hypothetical protein